MKTAVVNANDTGAVESLAHLLEQAGYRCVRPTPATWKTLHYEVGLEGMVDPKDAVDVWGYDEPTVPAEATLGDVNQADLFVDLKAHVNYNKIVGAFPSLAGKVLWYQINGGDPWKRDDPDLWCNPPCPLVTTNQWYADKGGEVRPNADGGTSVTIAPWLDRSYCFWPKFMRAGEYSLSNRHREIFHAPICLVHNVERWGYPHLVEQLKHKMYFYGVNSPHRMISRKQAKVELSLALCMLHLKIGDSVGYAVLEAIHAFCPIVCSKRYIEETKLGELLVDGETCLTFPEEATAADVDELTRRISDPETNLRITLEAKHRWLDLMNREIDRRERGEFKAFIERNFK